MSRAVTLVMVPLLMCAMPAQVVAQETLDRTAQFAGGWIGVPGALETHLRQLIWRPEGEGASLVSTSNLSLGFTVHRRLLVGSTVAVQSATVPGSSTEWELLTRARLLDERSAPVDASFTVAYNGAAGGVGGDASLGRWLGRVRLLGSARAFSNAFDEGRSRTAVGAGLIVHPAEGAIPIAVSGDLLTLTDRSGGERMAWSAGLHVGIAHTNHTIALFATNGTSGTLQGTSRGTARTRYGIELTVPMAIGRMFGWYPSREDALEAVTEDAQAEPSFRAGMRRHLFEPRAIEIRAGETVEWTNRDAVVHTVNAEDGTWRSGAIEPGERWRATFGQPGQYVFYCGPHPYMRGVVIVR